MGRARAAPQPLRLLLLLPDLERQALPAATLTLCLFPIPSLLIPGFSLSPLACLLLSRARSYPCPPHPEHPAWGWPCLGALCVSVPGKFFLLLPSLPGAGNHPAGPCPTSAVSPPPVQPGPATPSSTHSACTRLCLECP